MEIVETCIYDGPNRRAPHPAIEQLLQFTPEECEIISSRWRGFLETLNSLIASIGLPPVDSAEEEIESDCLKWFARVYGRLSVSLQHRSGHRVSSATVVSTPGDRAIRAVYQFEERAVAVQAGALALQFLQQACPGLGLIEDQGRKAQPGSLLWEKFKKFASDNVLPIDTEAIIAAAERRSVPWQKLDRFPFVSRPGDVRIRPNAGLRLGQSQHQMMLDGTFCVSRGEATTGLAYERSAALRLLRELNLPLPKDSLESGGCSTPHRARRTAGRVGYPLLCMVGRRPIAAPEVLVENEGQLASTVKKLASQGELLLQHRPPGHIYKALIGDRRLLCVLQMGGENQPLIEVTDQCPSSFLAHIDQLKRAVNSGLMCLSFVSEDISRSPFFFLDVDVAPRLDQFLTIDSPHLRSAADALLHWLFPAGVESRIPIIAITGTNGKTTTTNMVHWTLRSDGRRPGMANSDGLFDGERQAFYEGDSAGFSGHAMLLGDPRFDSLALETAHGGIANGGFAFDFCDVAVCVNVTRDHLFSLGIESVQDMAALKRSLLARARQGVVVNADNSMTLKMLPFPKAARTCLVSTGKSLVELEAIPGAADLFALVEGKDAKAEVVIYDSGQRMPVLPVNSLPVALGGIARYNLSNALHAAAACYLVGVKVVTIADSLASFHPNAEQNPGRFNIYDNLPFTVILDYAHNPDGLAQLASTIDRYKIPGRKIITVSAAAYQDDRTVCENARMVAGHFDHYYCFNYAGDVGRGKSHIATLVAEELHKIGVKEEKISIVDTEMEATRQALASADEHDLVVLLPGRTRRAEVLEMVTAQRSKQSTA